MVTHANPRTRDIDLYVTSYGEAQRFLRGKKQRKLANNTFVRDEVDSLTVVLHNTPVVEYFPTGLIVLRSGGHQTTTTKQRINQLLPAGWSLYQKDYNWYLRAPDGEVQDFFDGIAIHAGLRAHGEGSRRLPIRSRANLTEEEHAHLLSLSRQMTKPEYPGHQPNPEGFEGKTRTVQLPYRGLIEVRGSGATTYWRDPSDTTSPFKGRWILASPTFRKDIEDAEGHQPNPARIIYRAGGVKVYWDSALQEYEVVGPDAKRGDGYFTSDKEDALNTAETISRDTPQSNPRKKDKTFDLERELRYVYGDTTYRIEKAGLHGWQIKAGGTVISPPQKNYGLVVGNFYSVTGREGAPWVDTWEERDRLSIILYYGTPGDPNESAVIAEWWDDDARQMFEDGFFKSGRHLKSTVITYAEDHGLI